MIIIIKKKKKNFFKTIHKRKYETLNENVEYINGWIINNLNK